jgi:outer membrane protein TolC
MTLRITLFLLLTTTLKLPAQQVFVSLDQFTEYALKNNTNIQQAILNEQVEKQNRNSAISPLLPVAKGSATLSDNLILNTQLLPAEIFGGKAGTFKEVKFGTKYSFVPTADVAYNLINAANYQGLMIAEKNREVASLNTALTGDQIKNSIAQTYYTYLLSQDNLRYAEQNLYNADSVYAILNIRYKNQFADELDVNRAKSTRMQSENQRLQTEVSLKKVANELKLLAGISIQDSLVIQDRINPLTESESILLANSVLQRPAMRLSMMKTTLSKMALDKEKLRFIPDLSVFANYGVQAQNNNFNFVFSEQKWYKNSAIGVRLDVPIFSGAIKYFSVQKAKLNYQISQSDLKNTQNKLAKEDAELMLDFVKSKGDMQLRKQQLELSVRNYQLAMVKYRNQSLAYDQLVNINNELITAQQQMLQAQASYLTLKYKIQLNNSYSK